MKEGKRRKREGRAAAAVERPDVPDGESGGAEEARRFPIVGIGASAGGLKALQGFFDHMPSDSGLAFVVLQHLDPRHESVMSSILARHTAMAVQEIRDGTPVEPNRVYVQPPGRDVILADRVLRLLEPAGGPGPRLPIDVFFRSLAESHGELAICIVLSGPGRAGTLGLKVVKGAGGLAIAQAEAQAEYTSMPGSAIGTGLADFILPVERMPDEILQYTRHPSIRRGGAETREACDETDATRSTRCSGT